MSDSKCSCLKKKLSKNSVPALCGRVWSWWLAHWHPPRIIIPWRDEENCQIIWNWTSKFQRKGEPRKGNPLKFRVDTLKVPWNASKWWNRNDFKPFLPLWNCHGMLHNYPVQNRLFPSIHFEALPCFQSRELPCLPTSGITQQEIPFVKGVDSINKKNFEDNHQHWKENSLHMFFHVFPICSSFWWYQFGVGF